MPYKDPAKKAAWEQKKQSERSARRAAQRGQALALKPKRPSIFVQWITSLRSLPVEIVTGSIPFNPNALVIVSSEPVAAHPMRWRSPLADTAVVTTPEQFDANCRAIIEGNKNDSEKAAQLNEYCGYVYWYSLFHRKPPKRPSDSDKFWGTAIPFGSALIAKDGVLRGLLGSTGNTEEFRRELRRELLEKQALLDAAECEQEYRGSQVRIEMGTGPTGELILWGGLLKIVEAEVARNETLFRYFRDCEEERKRERRIKKPRKLLEQEWSVLALLERALQPTIKGAFRLEQFRQQLQLELRGVPQLERLRLRAFEAQLAADMREEMELPSRPFRIATALYDHEDHVEKQPHDGPPRFFFLPLWKAFPQEQPTMNFGKDQEKLFFAKPE